MSNNGILWQDAGTSFQMAEKSAGVWTFPPNPLLALKEMLMSFIGRLFKWRNEPEFVLEKAVGEYLLNLPQCSEKVAIVSSRYGEINYTCEIVVPAANLLPWAEHHADAVWSSNREEQAARKALPIWLRGADSTDNSISYVPHFMTQVLRPYVLDFVTEGSAKIYCQECQSFFTDVQMEKLNESRIGDWSWWADRWLCDRGHQLYHEEHELHIYRGRGTR